tara:strand:- start:468 stop:641 length:174 start_codon:yes stop_codon:yes gene_type:complete
MENKNFIEKIQELGKERFTICKECPELFHPTAQCKKCGCFMRVKVLMPDQKCPLDKW